MSTDNLETVVSTSNPLIHAEEEKGAPIRINKIGSPVTKSSIDQSVTDGRAFTVQQATPDTLLTGSTSYVATDPSIIFTVPEHMTVRVHEVQVEIEDMAGADNHITMGYASGDLFVSGGIASSTANCLNSSVGGVKSAIGDILNGDTAIVMLDPADKERIVFTKCMPFLDVNTTWGIGADYKPPISLPLVGPATFFVYIYGGTAPEYQFNLRYTEYLTDEII